MYDARTDYYTELQMSGRDLWERRNRAFGRHMRRSLWVEWSWLSWWKRLLTPQPPYEAAHTDISF